MSSILNTMPLYLGGHFLWTCCISFQTKLQVFVKINFNVSQSSEYYKYVTARDAKP